MLLRKESVLSLLLSNCSHVLTDPLNIIFDDILGVYDY